MEYFAGYGFNKSHSAAYAVITYQTAYLKANYPVQYMVAQMSCEKQNTDKIAEYIEDCRHMGIEVTPPDVNESQNDFTISDNNKIRFGLGAIKNVGNKAIESIIESRNTSGRFTSLFDLCKRVDMRIANKQVIEFLIKSGCFDALYDNRAKLLAGLDTAMQIGGIANKDRRTGQKSLFNFGDDAVESENLDFSKDTQINNWTERELRQAEKESLGVYMSSHPLNSHKEKIKQLSTVSSSEVSELSEGEEIVIGGIITNIRQSITKKGDPMLYVTLEDMSGAIECLAFKNEIKAYQPLLAVDMVVFIRAQVGFQSTVPTVRIKEIIPEKDALARLAKSMTIRLDALNFDENNLIQLKEIIKKHVGTCPLFFMISTPDNNIQIKTSSQYFVSVSNTFVSLIQDLFDSDGFQINQPETISIV